MRSNCDAARHVATKAIHGALVGGGRGNLRAAKARKRRGTPRRYKDHPFRACGVGGRGNLRAAKARKRRGVPRRYKDHPFRACGGGGRGNLRENREDQITTRRAASLRPSGNGRMGFKPPYSKRGNPSKPRMGSTFIGAFPFLRVERFQSCNLIYRRP